MSRIVRHVTIRGRVQAVGFRAFVEHMAAMHRIEGWVRNRRDGSVQAVFAGPPAAVERMVEACGRGPTGARVEAVDFEDLGSDDLSERYPGELFSVLPTR